VNPHVARRALPRISVGASIAAAAALLACHSNTPVAECPAGPSASTGAPNARFARYTATPRPTFDRLAVIVLSRTHADHVDARAREILPKALPVIVPPSGVESMKASGFTDVRALDWGQSVTLEAHGTKLVVTAVAAHHAHDVELDRTIGRVNGHVLAWTGDAGPYRVYWTGDHTSFSHYREPIEALVQRADEAGLGARFVFPTEGKPVALP
jgi:hypothetical protein